MQAFASISSEMREDEIDDILSAYKRKVASAGGKGRAKKLTAAQRSEIARKAVQTRWKKAKKKNS